MASLTHSLNKKPNIPSLSLPRHKSHNNIPTMIIVTKSTNIFPHKPMIITCSSSSPKSSLSSTKPKPKNPIINNNKLSLISNDDEVVVDVDMDDERELSEMWREIQGSHNWEGLLDPLNHHLRREIIRYGELAQACYDSFDFDPHSKYCGTCKYPGAHFFEKLGMSDHGYLISRYLYATSNINLPNFFQKSKMTSVWSSHANWMGYVAVSDNATSARLGRRDIVVAWRGTVTYLEWICDLKDILRPAGFGPDPAVKIESGFHDLYTKKEQDCKYCSFSAREQVLAEIKRLVDYYDGEEISISVTGHSLGSALAILSAYDIAEVGLNILDNNKKIIPVSVYSFAGPRVGNLRFKERCEELGVKVLRVVNVKDVVPTVPGIIANEKLQFQKYIEDVVSFPWSYAHVGVELELDQTQSPFLKTSKLDPGCAHNLEVHLHLVDGYHGKRKRFCLEIRKRDIALVNKSCDLLRGEYGVPPNWRQDENKGMVRDREGRWVLPERARLEGHPPDTALHIQKILMLLNNNNNGDGGVNYISS